MEEEKKELLENAAGVTGVTKPGAYTSQWQGQLSDAIGKILDRKEFSYDVNSDALYQQYKDRYVQGGKMAMMDTLGQAATLTGGYGNSYAQAAGQQAYQGYLQGLNDKIPELYQLALDKYSRESDGLYKRYSVLSAQEGQDYGRHQDSLNRYQQSWENAFRLYEAGVETPEVLGILGIPEETGGGGGSSTVVRRRSNSPEEPEEPKEEEKRAGDYYQGWSNKELQDRANQTIRAYEALREKKLTPTTGLPKKTKYGTR